MGKKAEKALTSELLQSFLTEYDSQQRKIENILQDQNREITEKTAEIASLKQRILNSQSEQYTAQLAAVEKLAMGKAPEIKELGFVGLALLTHVRRLQENGGLDEFLGQFNSKVLSYGAAGTKAPDNIVRDIEQLNFSKDDFRGPWDDDDDDVPAYRRGTETVYNTPSGNTYSILVTFEEDGALCAESIDSDHARVVSVTDTNAATVLYDPAKKNSIFLAIGVQKEGDDIIVREIKPLFYTAHHELKVYAAEDVRYALTGEELMVVQDYISGIPGFERLADEFAEVYIQSGLETSFPEGAQEAQPWVNPNVNGDNEDPNTPVADNTYKWEDNPTYPIFHAHGVPLILFVSGYEQGEVLIMETLDASSSRVNLVSGVDIDKVRQFTAGTVFIGRNAIINTPEYTQNTEFLADGVIPLFYTDGGFVNTFVDQSAEYHLTSSEFQYVLEYLLSLPNWGKKDAPNAHLIGKFIQSYSNGLTVWNKLQNSTEGFIESEIPAAAQERIKETFEERQEEAAAGRAAEDPQAEEKRWIPEEHGLTTGQDPAVFNKQ